ncbi:MAG TPA: ABC transporter permease [Myxococcaceae bacterium]|nr:ABC transporter permease [Myxococcaceae bacterium]
MHGEQRTLGAAEERSRGSALSGLRRDATYALRQLWRAPGFTAAAVGTLALGIGATSAIFSLVWAVVLKPLPGVDPQRTVAVESLLDGQPGGVSAGNFNDWQARATQFDHLAAVDGASFNLSEAGTPERVAASRVSNGFFDVFRTAPRLGRTFAPSEDSPGQEHVVVLGEGLWRRRFGGDPAVLGRPIRLGAHSYTVVGVMPAGFDPLLDHTQLWVPLALTPAQRAMHDEHYLLVLGTLKGGTTRPAAQREMESIAGQLAREFPQNNFGRTARVTPVGAFLVGDTAQQLWVLLGSVLLVLVIACLNVGNLLLARGTARTRELAVRAALGAGGRRIVRQLLTESVVLGLLGGAVGVVLAGLLVLVLRASAPADVPRLGEAELDGVVLAFALAVTLGSSLLFGAVPALRAARTDLHGTLQRAAAAQSGGGRDRLRGGLIVVEVALAATLLVGAGLLVRTALYLGTVEPGFRPRGLLSARLSLPVGVYDGAEAASAAFSRVVHSLEAMPGVDAAAVVTSVPLDSSQSSNGLVPEGTSFDPGNRINSLLRVTTPGYLRAMGLELLQGRFIDSTDVAGSERVMVISRALARAAFPGQDPIGKRIDCCEGGPRHIVWKTVVGVVEDVHTSGPAGQVQPEFYLPLAQAPPESWRWNQQSMNLVARSQQGDASRLVPVMRAAVAQLDPSLPLYDVATMETRLQNSTALYRFLLRLLGALGLSGLLLAAIGVYGVVAYAVVQRRREIGIRMALGATAREVLGMAARTGLTPVAIGLVLGVVLSVLLGRALAGVVRGVGTTDLLTLGCVAVLLLAASIAAVVVPSRRAARVNPSEALASE